jgi:hypothetical protein
MLGEALFHIVPLVVFPEPEENHNSAEWLALWLLLTLMAGFSRLFFVFLSLSLSLFLPYSPKNSSYKLP